MDKKVLEEAAKSPCKKRKVGAIIVNMYGEAVGRGHNTVSDAGPCEDINGNTRPQVIHAEINALKDMGTSIGETIYVSHQPCDRCMTAINDKDLRVEVVNSFMKFDTGKLRYDLIPPSSLKGLAAVLTYGAKKYKPNNWRGGDKDRYIAALFRHIEAWREGEQRDPESKLLHLDHALCNLAFLKELDDESVTTSNK